MELYNRFLELSIDDILFYKSEDLINKESKLELVREFLNRIDCPNYDKSIEPLLLPMISPLSIYHNNDPNIIWFEFDKLNELEKWVSNKLEKPFKLEVFGSSSDYKSKIIVDDYFKTKYNSIYDYYDIIKKQNTLI
jgi:hypothetical protein